MRGAQCSQVLQVDEAREALGEGTGKGVEGEAPEGQAHRGSAFERIERGITSIHVFHTPPTRDRPTRPRQVTRGSHVREVGEAGQTIREGAREGVVRQLSAGRSSEWDTWRQHEPSWRAAEARHAAQRLVQLAEAL